MFNYIEQKGVGTSLEVAKRYGCRVDESVVKETTFEV